MHAMKTERRRAPRQPLTLWGILLLTTMGLVACNSDSPTDDEPVATTSVQVDDNFFEPTDIMVEPGATVEWSWVGSTAHNVTWDEADLANSTTQTQGGHEVTMPSSPGTYRYHCTIHVSLGMRGTVEVDG